MCSSVKQKIKKKYLPKETSIFNADIYVANLAFFRNKNKKNVIFSDTLSVITALKKTTKKNKLYSPLLVKFL